MYLLACAVVFLATYLLNALVITIGYHRGLAHGAVQLSPALRGFVIRYGNWITGLDPKGWAVMHRRHHEYSDTPDDPHSPQNVGLAGILLEQLRSYEDILRRLGRKDPELEPFTEGLDFPLSWVNRKGVWWLPYVLHGVMALGLAIGFDAWLLGGAWFAGMMSHPFQGGTVNALGHAVGGRNFETPDQSTNNLLAAWLIVGEGYQNNHHAFPASAKFGFRAWEVDIGFGFCLLAESIGLLTIRYDAIIPAAPSATADAHTG